MSPSAFHRTFKTMTSLTPLQFQKQLRLLEARSLMLADAANAETAAYRSATRARRNSAESTLGCSALRPAPIRRVRKRRRSKPDAERATRSARS